MTAAAIHVESSGTAIPDISALPAQVPATVDVELLASLADGDQSAMAELYDRHSSAVFGLAFRVTRDRALAEEVTQEAFLGIWRNAARYDASRGAVRAWIMVIAHNRAIDAVRRRRPAVLSFDQDNGLVETLPQLLDVWSEVSAKFDAASVKRAFAKLPAPQSQSLELAYFSGLTQSEIAAATATPLGTVKSRVRLGLIHLREALSQEYEGDLGHTAA